MDVRTDLVILAADKNMASALEGMLNRPQSLSIRPISWQIYVHKNHDPGCRIKGVDFLKPFISQYKKAMLIFDFEGCGENQKTAIDLEQNINFHFSNTVWANNAKCFIIQPELEIWVWSDSPQVALALGWTKSSSELAQWLTAQNYLTPESAKPHHPKEAMEEVLRMNQKPRSSSIYASLASKVSFSKCQDQCFLRLKRTLKDWFGETAASDN